MGRCELHGSGVYTHTRPSGVLGGVCPRLPGLQDIEIWAESDSGLRGHLQCTVMLDYHAHAEARLLQDRTKADLLGPDRAVRLLLLPWVAGLITCGKSVSCRNTIMRS